MISYFEIKLILLFSLLMTLIIIRVGRAFDSYITKKTNWEYGRQQLFVAFLVMISIVIPMSAICIAIMIIRWNSML